MRRSGKAAAKKKIPLIYDWQQALMEEADIVFEDESLPPCGQKFSSTSGMTAQSCVRNPNDPGKDKHSPAL